MLAGPLDRLITIYRKQVTQSASGDSIVVWNAIRTCRASVKPVRGDERFNTPQLVAKDQVQFEVRYAPSIADLSPLDRVAYRPGVVGSIAYAYDILAIHEIGRRKGLRIIAFRQPDVQPVP